MPFPITLVPYRRVREWTCFDADSGKDSAREIREYFLPDFSNWKNPDSYRRSNAFCETCRRKAARAEEPGPERLYGIEIVTPD